jgi:hypothetical protein
LDSETLGFLTHDTTEAIAMLALTTFCGYHSLEMATHQVLQRKAMSHMIGLAQDAKVTIIDREDLVVDLSTELVEKDL